MIWGVQTRSPVSDLGVLGCGSRILGSADSAHKQDQPAQGLESKGVGTHTRTIQARHMVQSLLSETNLREPDPSTARHMPNTAETIK